MGAAAIEFAQIEPVGQCNLRCQMCPVQFRPTGKPHGPLAFMSFETFKRVLTQLPNLATLHLQGMGEPLMHPDFFRMVEYASARGIQVSTNTNLTLLSARRAQQCVASGLYELHASLDAASPELYEHIRVGARFSRVRRHLESLLDARATAASATPKVRIVVVLMRANIGELSGIVKLAHAYGVSSVFVQYLASDYADPTLPARYAPMRRFIEAQRLGSGDREEVARHFSAARAEATQRGIELRLPRTEPRTPRGNGRARCDWPWRGPYISYDGEVMPCCMVGTPDRARLGNVVRQDIDSVWNGATYESFRRALASDTPPSVCRSCAIYHGTF